MYRSTDLGTAPIRTLFFRYYTPALISIASVTIHQLVDGIILGQQVGKEGVAAIGLYAPILMLFIAFGLTLMIGGSILFSRYIGAAEYDKAQAIFQFTTTLVVIAGTVVAFSSPFTTPYIARFLVGRENEAMYTSTYDYMYWGFIWLPLFLLGMLWSGFVRNDNAPNISKNAGILSSLLNIILDLLLVVVFPFGVAGASIATGISVFASALYLFVYIRKGKGHLSFKNFRFTCKLNEWKELLRFGIPSFASELSFSFGFLLINKSLLIYGPLAVSAFGLINYASFIFLRLFTAAMIAIQPIIAFNLGAHLPQRVLETVKFSLIFTFTLGILVSAVGFFFPTVLVRVFSSGESTAFHQLAGNAIRLYFTLFIAAGANYILSIYLQSIGKSTSAIILNVLKGVAFVGFFLWLLPEYFGMGLSGIWLVRPFTEISTLLLMGMYTLYKNREYYSHEGMLGLKSGISKHKTAS